jgi:hypothetical protein
MTLTTTDGITIHLQDSPRDVSARRYMLFNQAWLKQVNLGSGGDDLQSHLQRLSMFLGSAGVAINKTDVPSCETAIRSAQDEFNNYVLTMQAIERPADSMVVALACLVTQIGDTMCTDLSEQGLYRTTSLLLDSELTQQQLTDTVNEVKKNYSLH